MQTNFLSLYCLDSGLFSCHASFCNILGSKWLSFLSCGFHLKMLLSNTCTSLMFFFFFSQIFPSLLKRKLSLYAF